MTPAGIGKEDKKIKLVKDVSTFRKFSFWRKFWGGVNGELSWVKRIVCLLTDRCMVSRLLCLK